MDEFCRDVLVCGRPSQLKALERVWELGTCCQFTDLQEEVTACMTPMKVLQADDDCVTIPRHCVQILIDQELTLLKVEPHAPLLQQQQIHSLAATLYDQFGQVTEGQTTDFGTVLTTEPLTHGVNAHDLVYVFAAFSQTNMSWHVCKLTNTITASFTGDRLAVEFLQKFFMHALTTHSRDVVGRKATVKDNGDLVFAPSRSSGVMPPNPFLIALSIAAAKTLLDGLETEADDLTGRATTIKWAGRPGLARPSPSKHDVGHHRIHPPYVFCTLGPNAGFSNDLRWSTKPP